MSEAKHTPGPWEMDLGVDGAVVYHPDQGTIADIPMDLTAHPNNARLIAAAPELLEALEKLAATLDSIGLANGEAWTSDLTVARTAIVKAKGTL